MTTGPKTEEIDPRHPEEYCHRCAGKNLSWATDSDIWNAVMRDENGYDEQFGGIVCPQCFAELFETKWPMTTFRLSLHEETRGAKQFRSKDRA